VHDWLNPVVLMQVALFVAAAAVIDLVGFVACTTAQLPLVQRNVFLPPAAYCVSR
jgi:hypothetical protein